MPLHDHPNMSVFFRLVYGGLDYVGYDKIEEKFKYNKFSENEYAELLGTKHTIQAKKTKQMKIKPDNMLYVRPSTNNMHQFIATENSCFFDICLPNYTSDTCLRKITYFKETGVIDTSLKGGLTELAYYTTPPVMPANFKVTDVPYKGFYN
jgi:hypothetical protein